MLEIALLAVVLVQRKDLRLFFAGLARPPQRCEAVPGQFTHNAYRRFNPRRSRSATMIHMMPIPTRTKPAAWTNSTPTAEG